MKTKLVKQGDRWVLYNEDGSKMALSTESPYNKLSKENCDEIFGVVDVGKLALEECNNTDPLRLDSQKYKQDPYFRIGFLKGYNKAMELNKDKLFTENDLRLAMHFGKFGEGNGQTTTIGFIKSLQPTEIEVEICCYIGNGDKESDSFKEPLVTNTGIPKLDENGCLILKRI
jgi:hypothetical protein